MGAGGVYFYPDALGEEAALVVAGEGGLEGEEGAVFAVAVYPAADDVYLIYFGLAYDAGWLSKGRGYI